MVNLVPMRPEHFAVYAREAVASYAADKLQSLLWRDPGALAQAQAAFERLLPQGLATPSHVLCEIRRAGTDETVGALWYQFDAGSAERTLYLFNIVIEPQHRGRGLAKAALDQLQRRALALGAQALALHVFNHNPTAQALYRGLGFGITGFNMVKRLDDGGATGT